jgi:glycosyltransferase involved in cell wall biosynthesis
MDLALLRERYAVREWHQKSRAVNLSALGAAIQDSDLVFGWFASWHTFFPALLARALKRPVVLVVGGYDTANLPEIGYGSQRGGIKKWIAQTTMRWATRLITHSMYARDEVIRNVGIDSRGVAVIHPRLDAQEFVARAKENLVITVGNVDRDNLQRKGLEPFVRAAAHLPEIPFSVIGARRDGAIDFLRGIATPNVQFTGWVDDETLRDHLARARVYAQPSRHEGFGLSVAEAMLSECIPVVTRAGALPEVVGDAGIYIDAPEPAAIANGVRRALAADAELGRRARERIAREFPLERRRGQLYALIDSLTTGH